MSLQDKCPFTISAIHQAMKHRCFSKGISACIPPPGFAHLTSSPVAYTRRNELFMQMTSRKGVARYFDEVVSKQDREELLMTVSLLTSNSDFFMSVIRSQCGSRRVQALLGMSDDVDALFCAAILRRFLDVMTNKFASYVATQAMVVFDQVKKHELYGHAIYYALDIACDHQGGMVLKRAIADVDDPIYKNQLLDVVTRNALLISADRSGSFVVQHVFSMNDMRYKHNVAVSLRGHCVDLSFKKYGRYVVEKLLEDEVTMAVVVKELLECDGDRLMSLASCEFGSLVVSRALEVTEEMNRDDLFWRLVRKLMPFRHLLLRSRVFRIVSILERCSITRSSWN
ncbi:unnamed protein product [Eruca vesicaria subsp. sativa]|uniref:PUM-HD domain-containing protein n=1 Tax=Eruca vesicaria subsp. sativa TaxID=29727 RepID=A0ABC8JTI7_ERUVS|nr:unnamed protein product [Eruca vesicaria subsp. sativa]